jgi:N-acetyl-gamma-glutamyl-phosphate reductase
MIRAGIFGATGYAGAELVKLLTRHAHVDIAFATSDSFAGKRLNDLYPAAPALALIASDSADLSNVDVVFLCLPHAAAAPTAIRALDAGVRVIDLSADFRLRDVATYEKWYGVTHPAPALLAEAVYGLTEIARDKLPNARLVATPGCYPTSMLLGTRPLLEAGVVTGTIISDSKSGVSGAGRKPTMTTHFVEISNNLVPYKIGQAHRHLPETVQVMKWFDPNAPELIFSPHLIPIPRGLLSTLYVPISADAPLVRTLYETMYADEPLIDVLPDGQIATVAHAVNTNKCVISVQVVGNLAIVVSVIDNLGKGAAGQAVQNMNVVFSIAETEGLHS